MVISCKTPLPLIQNGGRLGFRVAHCGQGFKDMSPPTKVLRRLSLHPTVRRFSPR